MEFFVSAIQTLQTLVALGAGLGEIACLSGVFFRIRRYAIAATRLIPLHVVKGQTIAKCLSDRIGYARWAKRFNLKQMSQVLIYLQEYGINDYDELVRHTDDAYAHYDQLATSIKSAETRLTEIATHKKHIFNYSRTKDIYAAYRSSGYSKQFYEEQREELTLHKAARDAFNQLDGKVPRIKDLNAEYAAVLDQKKRDYAEYRAVRVDMRQLLLARKNIEILLELDEDKDKRDQKRGR